MPIRSKCNGRVGVIGAAVLLWLGAHPGARAIGSPNVTITGGADTSGHNYTWTITNGRRSPIVFLEFSHYGGSVFLTPPGWSGDCTFLVNVGVEDKPGVCRASATNPSAGIRRDHPVRFQMQVSRAGVRQQEGTVFVRFADGGEVRVQRVMLPQQEGLGDQYVSLIGLGVIFITWVLVRTVARAKARRNAVNDTRPDTGK